MYGVECRPGFEYLKYSFCSIAHDDSDITNAVPTVMYPTHDNVVLRFGNDLILVLLT